MKKYLDNIIICLNKFKNDSINDIEYIKQFVTDMNVEFEICDSYQNGSKGAISIAKKIIKMADKDIKFNYLYDINDTIKNKIEILSKEIYHAKTIKYEAKATENILKLEKLCLDKLPLCVCKTQYSISDDSKKLGFPKDYEITIKNIEINNGAGFIIVYMGNIVTMPGLSRKPAYENMYIDEDGNIEGLF